MPRSCCVAPPQGARGSGFVDLRVTQRQPRAAMWIVMTGRDDELRVEIRRERDAPAHTLHDASSLPFRFTFPGPTPGTGSWRHERLQCTSCQGSCRFGCIDSTHVGPYRLSLRRRRWIVMTGRGDEPPSRLVVSAARSPTRSSVRTVLQCGDTRRAKTDSVPTNSNLLQVASRFSLTPFRRRADFSCRDRH